MTRPNSVNSAAPIFSASLFTAGAFRFLTFTQNTNVRFGSKADITGIQGTTGKWVSNVLLISITLSLVKPPPAASSEIALR